MIGSTRRETRRSWFGPAATGCLVAFAWAFAAPVADADVTVLPFPYGGAGEHVISGPGGALWIDDFHLDGSGGERHTSLDVVDASGHGRASYALNMPGYRSCTAYDGPGLTSAVTSRLVTGSDGNVWFGSRSCFGGGVGRITPTGAQTYFGSDGLPPSSQANDMTVNDIASGPDGALWFTGRDDTGRFVGTITVAGAVTLYRSGITREPLMIAAGRDGNLWFTEQSSSGQEYFGRVTPSGVVSEYPAVHDGLPSYNPAIAVGPAGSLFASDFQGIVRLNYDGSTSPYNSDGDRPPVELALGPDGKLWGTGGHGEYNVPLDNPSNGPPWFAAMEQVSSDGSSAVQYCADSASGFGTVGLAAGPDNRMWAVESGIVDRDQPENDRPSRLVRVDPGTPSNCATSAGGPAAGPPKVTRCTVPKLKGKSLAAARKALKRAHCRLGKVIRRRSGKAKRGHVLAQHPAPGRRRPRGTRVSVDVAS